MKKQPITTREERKLKFAEAGILFVLVLAITIFVGVRVADQDGPDVAAATGAATPVRSLSDLQTGAGAESVVAAEAETGIAVTAAEPEVAPEPEAAPVRGPVTYALAEETYFGGAYGEAAELFGIYSAEHTDNAWGHYMLGLSAWKAGDTVAADEAFAAALAIKPDHLKSLVNSARVLIELDRVADARERIDAALALAPASIEVRRVSARVAHNEGRLDEAESDYLTVLQGKGDDAWSLNNLGLIRIEQERFGDALAPLARAASLKPDWACVQNNLGVALERTGHYVAAGEAYTAALAADAGYAKADESLARVNGLTETADLVAIDLAGLAESFDPFPAPSFAAAEAEVDTIAVGDEFGGAMADLAVATAAGDGNDDDPDHDGPQDR